MKNIRHIIIVLLGVAAVSCQNYLDVKPQGKVVPKTNEEFAAILNYRLNNIETGSYDDVLGNIESMLVLESYSDNLETNISSRNLPKYPGDKINYNDAFYEDWFSVIKDCNIIIGEMSKRDGKLPNQLLSASYALKGICYYNLMRNYCMTYNPSKASTQLGVPIVEVFDVEARLLRSDLKATADYTIGLLHKSLEFNVTDPTYMFTPDVVKAFLAKAYFWTQQWDKALVLCEELLAKPEYSLKEGTAYTEMIQARYNKLPGVVIRSYINGNASLFDSDYTLQVSASKERPVSKSFVDLFVEKDKDIRYGISFDKKNRKNNKNVCARIREGELHLMAAECYYHNEKPDEALRMLNELRAKRITGVVEYTTASLPEVNANALVKVNTKGQPLDKLLSAIFDERRKELFMEGDRWFELKRNGSPERWFISNGLKYTTKSYMYTFPINMKDVDLVEGMVQNEGYIK